MIKAKKTLKQVYSLHQKVLLDKPFYEYSEHDILLRVQRSTIEKYISDCDVEKDIHHIRKWILEDDKGNEQNKVMIGTWKWILGINKRLPVRIRG